MYNIAHEMMTSERAFVDALHLIHVIFREFVLAAAATTAKRSLDHIIPSEDFNKIFNNIGELMIFNSDLLRDFEDRIRHWEDKKKIADVIRMKGAYLKMYTTYIKDFKEMMEHFEECLDRFPRFRDLVSEFESKEICHKLRLTHYMLKPVQVGRICLKETVLREEKKINCCYADRQRNSANEYISFSMPKTLRLGLLCLLFMLISNFHQSIHFSLFLFVMIVLLAFLVPKLL